MFNSIKLKKKKIKPLFDLMGEFKRISLASSIKLRGMAIATTLMHKI
jgi:hypothetical protein